MGVQTADRRPKGIQGDHNKEHLGRFNHDENKFLNCIVTGDKMWVHYAEPKTKPRKQASALSSKKFKLSPYAGKVMLVVCLEFM